MSYKATNKAGQHQHLWLTSLIAHVRLYLCRHCCTPFFCIPGIHGEATPLPTNEIILPASRPPIPVELESDDSDDHSEPPASPSPTLSEPLTFLENPHPDDSPHALDDSTPVELDGVAKIDGLGLVCFYTP